jgi:hypothetical protein
VGEHIVLLVWLAGAIVFAVGLTIGKQLDGATGSEVMGVVWPILVPVVIVVVIWEGLCWLTRLRIVVKAKEVERGE